MKVLFNLFLSAILIFTLSGCGLPKPDWAVSPGRVDHYQLQEEVAKLEKLRNELPIPAEKKLPKLEIIGHGAGSYRHYPMDINKNDFPEGNDSKAKNVSHLIDTAFVTELIDAIEIDAQLPETSHELCQGEPKPTCSFIMHNTPKWKKISKESKPKTFTFMQENTVSSVLTQFVARGYHQKGKRVYLELKCDDSKPNVINCVEAGSRVADDIKEIIRTHKSAEGQKNWLTITSFFPDALESFYNELKEDLQKNVDYALIAGYDKGYKKWPAQSKGAVPQFDSKIQSFATKTHWLDRIWFSTKGISKPASVFQKIDQKRKSECKREDKTPCKDLEFSVASYDRCWKNFSDSMNGDTPFTLPLVSIMIDIED